MLTDNKVLVNKLNKLPALMCAQRKAEKKISTDDDFIKSNIESFGNEIGQTTNWITSMFEVQAKYEKGSREYETLAYRIKCGQLFQQNSIDKSKGIICKPMPKTWHDRHAANKIEDETERDFYRSIVADKKPYFMRYIYPALMNQYNTYIKNTERSALREFQMTVDELRELPYRELTDRQKDFLRYYDYRMPVGINDCVMNKICRRFESEFDGYIGKHNSAIKFDYTIMRGEADYSNSQFNSIKKLYDVFNKKIRNYAVFSKYERIDECESFLEMQRMNDSFRRECDIVCQNEDSLCNIILDLCYAKSSTKKFVWSMCGQKIIHNLLLKNNSIISFPILNQNGDIEYCGNKFSIMSKQIEVSE